MAANSFIPKPLRYKVKFSYLCGIYQILNTHNGKCYIGSSKDFNERRTEHLKCLEAGLRNRKFQNAWNAEADKDTFVFNILAICPEPMLKFYEQLFIDELNPKYNGTPFAHRPDIDAYWAEASPEQRQLQTASMRAAASQITFEQRSDFMPKGEAHWKASVTNDVAHAIKLHPGTCKDIATAFAVKESVVYEIKHGTSWTHIDCEIVKPVSGHRGAGNSKAKLTEESAAKVRTTPGTASELAQQFGVHTDTIRDIKAGRTWVHLTTPITPLKTQRT